MITITWKGPPRWWAKGRPAGRAIQYVVIHDTEGSEGASSAEAGIAYDKVRANSVSTHIFVDTDTALREVQDVDTAYAAYPKGNALGVQVELCHAGTWVPTEPNDAATLENGAQVVAQLCLAHGIPPVHLSVAQVRAAWYGDAAGQHPRGLCGHWDVTRAYPEDGGDHTDPGTSFPWDAFCRRVAQLMGAGPTDEGDIMRYVFDATWADRPATLGGRVVRTDQLGHWWVERSGAPTEGMPAPATISATDDKGNTFDGCFFELTGGGVYDRTATSTVKHGTADWRQPPAASGGGVSAADAAAIADARIRSASLTPGPTP